MSTKKFQRYMKYSNAKHRKLSWDHDFEAELSEQPAWLNSYDVEQELDD